MLDKGQSEDVETLGLKSCCGDQESSGKKCVASCSW